MTIRTKIAELRKLAEEATPGPWADAGWGHISQNGSEDGWTIHVFDWQDDRETNNAAFIAASREGLPWALEQLETAIGLLEECVTGPVYVDMVMAEKMRDFLAGRKP
jgi:hypothetical protein